MTSAGAVAHPLTALVDSVRANKPIILTDDQRRGGEGFLVLAAQVVTTASLAFMIRHSSGFVRIALPEAECERLHLPLMPCVRAQTLAAAHCVGVDAAAGVGTGISAADRAHTARLLVNPAADPDDFHRPGHLVPVRARQGGVLVYADIAEAVVDLTRLAGLQAGGVYAEVVSHSSATGDTAREAELLAFATRHSIETLSLSQLGALLRDTLYCVNGIADC